MLRKGKSTLESKSDGTFLMDYLTWGYFIIFISNLLVNYSITYTYFHLTKQELVI